MQYAAAAAAAVVAAANIEQIFLFAACCKPAATQKLVFKHINFFENFYEMMLCQIVN